MAHRVVAILLGGRLGRRAGAGGQAGLRDALPARHARLRDHVCVRRAHEPAARGAEPGALRVHPVARHRRRAPDQAQNRGAGGLHDRQALPRLQPGAPDGLAPVHVHGLRLEQFRLGIPRGRRHQRRVEVHLRVGALESEHECAVGGEHLEVRHCEARPRPGRHRPLPGLLPVPGRDGPLPSGTRDARRGAEPRGYPLHLAGADPLRRLPDDPGPAGGALAPG
mmetsp:Transcript_30333/g.91824  ORF Transcript_30333/g.91824 Transcript_30333/m.91824 type:complete len:223 (+) Transcript_30333:1555-2223(+)